MIKLELTGAEVSVILHIIGNYPDDSDYLDVLYDTIITQKRGQEG